VKFCAPDSPFTAIVTVSDVLIRFNLEHHITTRLSSPYFLHADRQEALKIEIRSEDERTSELMKPLDNRPKRMRCSAERSLLQGDCSPIIDVQSLFQSCIFADQSSTVVPPRAAFFVSMRHCAILMTVLRSEPTILV
jgi:porphobilinogen deaminase